MFTVLHRENGIERLYPAAAVIARGPHATEGPQGVAVERTIKGDGSFLILSGDVFVMNEAGATVATYKFGPAPTPPKDGIAKIKL